MLEYTVEEVEMPKGFNGMVELNRLINQMANERWEHYDTAPVIEESFVGRRVETVKLLLFFKRPVEVKSEQPGELGYIDDPNIPDDPRIRDMEE